MSPIQVHLRQVGIKAKQTDLAHPLGLTEPGPHSQKLLALDPDLNGAQTPFCLRAEVKGKV